MRKAGLAFAAVALVGAAAAHAGQPININSLPAGTRFCPAPGADNTEFMSSYFSIDARTGQMTRHDANSGPVGVTPEPIAQEEVLFVSPPISVENVYVPPPGGSAVPPQTHATGVYRQPQRPQQPRQMQQRPLRQQPYPQQQAQRPQPMQPQYRQPQYPVYAQTQPYPQYPQPQYAHPYPQQRAYPQPY